MSKHYNILDIQQYLKGELSAQEMHKLELDALEDEMLQDAIEGFELSKAFNHKQLSLLQQRLEIRIEAQQEEKNRFYFTGQRLAIASVAGVLMIVVAVLFWMMSTQSDSRQAATGLEKAEVLFHIQEKAQIDLLEGNIVPQAGWSSYQDYLSVNGSKIKEGEKVHIYFTVVEGRPHNIKIVSSSSEYASEELIRLVKEGPLWNGRSGVIKAAF